MSGQAHLENTISATQFHRLPIVDGGSARAVIAAHLGRDSPEVHAANAIVMDTTTAAANDFPRSAITGFPVPWWREVRPISAHQPIEKTSAEQDIHDKSPT